MISRSNGFFSTMFKAKTETETSVLHLNLHRQFLAAIAAGMKRIEYRKQTAEMNAAMEEGRCARHGLRLEPQRSGARSGLIAILLACAAMLQPSALFAEMIPVRHTEGLIHGFLVVRTLEGKALADGQMTQDARGDRVTSHVIFRFKDGSIYEETTIFSQRGTFRLLSDHFIQRGPSFKQPMDTLIDASTGQVKVRYTDARGKEKVITQRMKLPPDVANGLLFTLIKDVNPRAPRTTVSWVATTPKPRLVKLAILPRGEEPFTIGRFHHKAMHYVVKVEIGGVTGFLARLMGKQPADTHVWVLGGGAPAFVKAEGPFYVGGPIWRIQLASAGIF
jgi:hypothetical protein